MVAAESVTRMVSRNIASPRIESRLIYTCRCQTYRENIGNGSGEMDRKWTWGADSATVNRPPVELVLILYVIAYQTLR